MKQVGGKVRGRPRSAEAEAAVIAAATSLMDEMLPADISAEAIAARAGVSKATLYKWWPSKTHVLMDAVLERANQAIPLPDTGSVREDLVYLLQQFTRFHTETRFGLAVTHIFAETLNYPDIAKIYNERYAIPRRKQIIKVWQRGVERGELRADIDPNTALDLMYGPPVYRFFMGHYPTTVEFAAEVVDTLLRGLAPVPAGAIAEAEPS